MRILSLTAAGLLVFAAATVCSGQGFPLRPGEWEAKSEAAGQPISLLFCFTDDTWRKGLTQPPPHCTIQQLSVTSTGIHYQLECDMKTVQMKGPIDLTFDGMEHMIGKGSFTVTTGGKTTTSQNQTDYHWKNATCSPTDVNLRSKSAH